jgi:Flp pilus assembly protein TadD
MRRGVVFAFALLVAASPSAAAPRSSTLVARTSPGVAAPSPTLAARTRALQSAYDLDYLDARAELLGALRDHPDDVPALRSLAAVVWLEILFRRGTVTVDDYLGPLSRQHVKVGDPPAELATEFTRLAARAQRFAERALTANPGDLDSRYELGAVAGLQVSYMATVEGKVLAAIGAARRAYDQHERVLAAAPGRKDAGLVVGTYRYVVGSLSPFLRLLAMVAGFGGDRDRGLRMIEEAAAFGSDTQAEAQFALVLLYNRERRFPDALRVVAELERRFPRNRLLWLEHGATALRAGRPEEAERALETGFAKFSADARPKLTGEEALWRLKRGTAKLALGQNEEAKRELDACVSAREARNWVRGRARMELGRLAERRGDRAAAAASYGQAAGLCRGDNDPVCADEARRLEGAARKGW